MKKNIVTMTRLRQIIKEELFNTLTEADPADAKGQQQGPTDLAGSPDAVMANIAKLLGNEQLKTSLVAAVKNVEAGNQPSQLGSDKKLALADAFLDLIFADPQKTALVAAQLKKISAKPVKK